MSRPVLAMSGLSLGFPGVPMLEDAGFEVLPGECVAIVGESGAGKSTLVRAVLGIQDAACELTGSIKVGGVEVIGADQTTLRRLRGDQVGFLGQDPYGAYDMLMSVERNVAESWRIKDREVTREQVHRRLSDVGIAQVASRARLRPPAWSGGMLQRAQVVAATALAPPLVVADEPTSALDPVNARRVLSDLRSDGRAVLLVSHDRQIVADHADRVLELADGRLRPAEIERPTHVATNRARAEAGERLLDAHGISRRYPSGGGLAPLDLSLDRGSVYGIRGESGSGKSTLLRVLGGIEEPSSGSISWQVGDGVQQRAALIHQNARTSINPRWGVTRIINEPDNLRLRDRHLADVTEALRSVGLAPDLQHRQGRALSGGQAQRVAVARAAQSSAPLILADEPTAALDPKSAAEVLTLLRGLAEGGRTVVIVSHDDGLLERYCDEIVTIHPADPTSD